MIEGRVLFRTAFLAGCVCAALLGSAAAATDGDEPIVIKARAIHIGNGEVIENGMILIEDGRIVAVGSDLSIPDGARVVDASDGAVTPGLIDANARLEPSDLVSSPQHRRTGVLQSFLHAGHYGSPDEPCYLCDGSIACEFADTHRDLKPGQVCPICGTAADGAPFSSGLAPRQSRTEGSSEVVPHTQVLDSLDLRSPDFARLLRGGVTTVYASPDSAAVLGPRGTILKTAGAGPSRVLLEAGAVQATIGGDAYRVGVRNGTPSRFRGVTSRTRRPSSRMGVAWVFRKAFYDATQKADEPWISGTDRASDAAFEVLRAVAAREVPLRVHARTMRDIYTALRVCDEFGLSFTLLEATEAYRCLDVLKERSIPVIFGPIYDEPSGPRARTRESRETRLNTMRRLLDTGVDTALSAQDLREENGLARQAMYAMRAGLTREEALTAVTLTPARMLGLDAELGSIEAGKQADLVVWSGPPFDATSKLLVVIINGEIEFEDAAEK